MADVETDEVAELIESARSLFANGDVDYALGQMALAFGTNPEDERLLETLSDFAGRCDLLVRIPDDKYFGTALLRAHALRLGGGTEAGLALMADVIRALPHLGLERLLARWLRADRRGGRAPGAAAPNIAAALSAINAPSSGLHRLRPGERALVEGFGAVAEAVATFDPEPELACAAAPLLVRLGRFEAASRCVARHRDWPSEVFHALVLRAEGRGAEAATAFERLARTRTDHRELVVDAARAWFVAGEERRALRHLDALTEADARSLDIKPLLDLCRRPVAGDRIELLDTLRREELAPDLEPPPSWGASVFGRPDRPQLSGVRMGSWESPSARLLFALVLCQSDDCRVAPYTMTADAPAFDPMRCPPGVQPLWVLDGEVPVASQPALGAEFRQALGLATRHLPNYAGLWPAVESVVQRLAPDLETAFAAVLHPPLEGFWLWGLRGTDLYVWQIAAAMAITRVAAPWAERRARLRALIDGPLDWTGGAAILALAEQARREPEHAAEIRDLLVGVVEDLVPAPEEPRFGALRDALQTLPTVPPDATARLHGWWKRWCAPVGEPPEPSPPPSPVPTPERPGSLTPDSSVRWLLPLLFALMAAMRFCQHSPG